MVSHDATVGAWTGVGEARSVSDARGTKQVLDLGYLAPVRRGQVILAALGSKFEVTGEDGVASVSVTGQGGEADNPVKIAYIERPEPAVFSGQLQWLRNYADLRADRIPEIIAQANDILSFFGAFAHLNSSKRKHSLELLELTQYLTVNVEMQVKHWCRSARPVDRNMKVQPIIQTPTHSAFPSGHATEAFAIATVFHKLTGGSDTKSGLLTGSSAAFALAHRIAANRVVAGVHYPVDSASGAVLGCMIGEALIAIGTGGQLKQMSYAKATNDNADETAGEAFELKRDQDFTLPDFENVYPATDAGGAPAVELFKELWKDAKGEW